VIREAGPHDYAAAFAVTRAAFPEFVTTEAGFRHRHESMPPEARLRAWIAEEDGAVVGWSRAHYRWEESGGSAHASAAVLPERRRRGIGSALLEPALAHVGEAPRVFAKAGSAGAAFAERHGFRRMQTVRISAVDPRDVDVSDLDRTDVEVRTLAELGPEEVFAVGAVAVLDVPAEEQPNQLELEQWVRSYWESPDFDWDASYGAVVGGRTVAVSYSAVDLPGQRAVTAFTGTLPEYRGRGLARLVKLAVLRRLVERGVTLCLTDNHERNAPMLAVNTRLGFRPYAEHYTYLLDRSGKGARASAGRT
jgi:ribosomal protein S18 acetylase RimI-like enzyme